MEVLTILKLLMVCLIKGGFGLLQFVIYILPLLIIALGLYKSYKLLKKPIMKFINSIMNKDNVTSNNN